MKYIHAEVNLHSLPLIKIQNLLILKARPPKNELTTQNLFPYTPHYIKRLYAFSNPLIPSLSLNEIAIGKALI